MESEGSLLYSLQPAMAQNFFIKIEIFKQKYTL